MQEFVFQFDTKNPVEIFGVNNANIDLIKSYFPKLKIISRGTEIIAKGESSELDKFQEKLSLLVEHFGRYHHLTESNIELLLSEQGEDIFSTEEGADQVLVYGTHGNLIKARTPNQRKIIKESDKNDLVFAIGPAGTGKTYTAVALAVRALKNKEVRKLILTRPAVEAGEHLGFLPGDLKEKLDPYLQPLYDALNDMIPAEKLGSFIEKGIVQIAPLAFMRGRTLDNAFVILDEAQNTTESQMKMFLTRMGKNAKFIITGDQSQIDLPRNQPSGLVQAIRHLEGVKGISFVYLDGKDVVRHKLVKSIIEAYDKEIPSGSKKSNRNE